MIDMTDIISRELDFDLYTERQKILITSLERHLLNRIKIISGSYDDELSSTPYGAHQKVCVTKEKML